MPTIYKPKKIRRRDGKRAERVDIYSSPCWYSMRKLKKSENPICEVCESQDIITPMDDVHHLVTFVGITDEARKREVAFDYDNLISVCKACHHKLHHGYRWDKENKKLIKNKQK